MDKFRKLIFKSRLNLGLFMGTFFGLFILIILGRYNIGVFIVAAISGTLFGIIMSFTFWQSFSYFINQIHTSKSTTRKQYVKLFKRNQLPDSNMEYPQYKEFLDGISRMYKSLWWTLYLGPAIFALSLVSTLIDKRYKESIFYGIVVALYIFYFYYTRRSLRRIDELKARMH